MKRAALFLLRPAGWLARVALGRGKSIAERLRRDKEKSLTKADKNAEKGLARSWRIAQKRRRSAAKRAMRKRRAMAAHILREVGHSPRRARKIAGYSWVPLRKALEIEPGTKRFFAVCGAVVVGVSGTVVAAVPGSVWLFRGPRLAGAWLGREYRAALEGLRVIRDQDYRRPLPSVVTDPYDSEGDSPLGIDIDSIETNIDLMIAQIRQVDGIGDTSQVNGTIPITAAAAWATRVRDLIEVLGEQLAEDANTIREKVTLDDDGETLANIAALLPATAAMAQQLGDAFVDVHADSIARQLRGDISDSGHDVSLLHG